MTKIYAYAGCDTCRKALKFLNEQGIAHEVIAIREQPPTKVELKQMLAAHEGALRKLFNTSGRDYKELGLGTRLPTMKTDEALRLLAANGNLVKRPFVVADRGGLVGFKVEEWKKFFAVT